MTALFGTEVFFDLSTELINIIHCIIRKFGCLQKQVYLSLELHPRLWTYGMSTTTNVVNLVQQMTFATLSH